MNPSAPVATPPAEFELDSGLVSALLADQHPDLAHLSPKQVDAGWDNYMFRLGDELAVRLPRRAVAAPLIAHEQKWLPRLAPQLTLPVPTPCRIGKPALGYPWSWSIVPWLNGTPSDQDEPSAAEAPPFGAFLRSLHKPAPTDAPLNPVRGVPLSQRALAVEARMQRLARKTNLISTQIKDIWEEALSAPLDVPATWLHGDLHPRNVLVEHRVLSGIIDWGDICSGDCATDLAAIWMLFAGSDPRDLALESYGDASSATIYRAKGWAVLFAVTLLETGLSDSPHYAAIGERVLRRLADSEEDQHRRAVEQ